VAFSGEVKDPGAPSVTYSEPQMNLGIKETELPDKFASDVYQILIVANKYQTGFAAVFFKLKGEKNLADNAKLNAWLDPAVDRFKALRANDKDEEGTQRQEDFRGKLSAYKNLLRFPRSDRPLCGSGPGEALHLWPDAAAQAPPARFSRPGGPG